MTFLVERRAELRRHVDHLATLRPKVGAVADLEADLSLHNDLLFSLLTVCQLVIDIAGELSARAATASRTTRPRSVTSGEWTASPRSSWRSFHGFRGSATS